MTGRSAPPRGHLPGLSEGMGGLHPVEAGLFSAQTKTAAAHLGTGKTEPGMTSWVSETC